MKEKIMKSQTALKSLVLIAILLASALVGYGGDVATGQSICLAAPVHPSEMRSNGIELAAKGIEVGRMADEDSEQPV
jgi:hypothetical protein